MARPTFKQKFRQNVKRVGKRLAAYLADPESEKTIHDVRTAIRRLDATFPLLPKKARRRYRGSIEKYREFLKASSNARDCDIIAGRISTLGNLDTSDLQKKKKAEIAKATRLAQPLKRLPPMRLAGAPDGRRIDKVVRRLAGSIGKMLPVVLSDSSKVEDLHRLRKDFRRMRYVLEMVPAGDRKVYVKKAFRVTDRDVALKELQALLGLIHDSDITIEYLRSRRSRQFLNKEVAIRTQLYKKFVRYMKK
jgi:CHAD domain-containing protein